MKIPVISVIIPTYNRKELLEKAVLSVINQNKDIPYDRELVIVDDGGKDWTSVFIEKYLKDFPENITYIYNTHSWIPGVWRNIWLNKLRKDSMYTIFLDDDDEFSLDLFSTCLKKRNELMNSWKYDTILWLYFLCENELWEVVWKKKILYWESERFFTYDDYLQWAINIEMWLMTKSVIFFEPIHLRFSDSVITEWVMRSKMWQYMDINDLRILLRDYVWRIYKVNHTSQIQVTKIISEDRFLKNALWNKQIFEIIKTDLLDRWLGHTYADYLFRIGINYILAGKKIIWIDYIKKSLSHFFDIKVCIVYFIALVLPQKMLQYIYKMYVS